MVSKAKTNDPSGDMDKLEDYFEEAQEKYLHVLEHINDTLGLNNRHIMRSVTEQVTRQSSDTDRTIELSLAAIVSSTNKPKLELPKFKGGAGVQRFCSDL